MVKEPCWLRRLGQVSSRVMDMLVLVSGTSWSRSQGPDLESGTTWSQNQESVGLRVRHQLVFESAGTSWFLSQVPFRPVVRDQVVVESETSKKSTI